MQKFTNINNIPLSTALWLATDEYQYAKFANEISVKLSVLPKPESNCE